MPLVRNKCVRKLKQLRKRRRNLVRQRLPLATKVSACKGKRADTEKDEEHRRVGQTVACEVKEESRDVEEECMAEEVQPTAAKKRRMSEGKEDQGKGFLSNTSALDA